MPSIPPNDAPRPDREAGAAPLSRLVDLVYLLGLAIAAPWWLPRMALNGRLRTDWRGRLGFGALPGPAADGRPRVLLHAVSVGEVALVRLLVEELERRGIDVIVSATTDTGFRRACELYGAARVVRHPLDFSWAVHRLLDRLRPDLLVLVELEVWPNTLRACRARGIATMVVNGRLSRRSARRYRVVRPLLRPTFALLDRVLAQDAVYGERFVAMGVAAPRLLVTGTMKWDTAEIADAVEGSAALAALLGIDTQRPLVVAGSTAPGEHELLRDSLPAGAQLLCAPRRPEWFDEAARALPGCVRRSRVSERSDGPPSFFLLDSIGELRRAYALADLVVVGRSFVPLGGSDMIEPIGLGKATIVGPHAENFEESMRLLEAAQGVVRCDASALRATLASLLADRPAREAIAGRGRAVIRGAQGATARTADAIDALLGRTPHGAA